MTDTPKYNGGPAFPVPDERDAYGNGIMEGSPGMSMRDYFAGQALAGFLANPDFDMNSLDADIAEAGFLMADAMLKERTK